MPSSGSSAAAGAPTAASLIISRAAALGLIISTYALYVEWRHHQAAETGIEFKASCDFGPMASCSAVLSSKYGKALSHFGIVEGGSALDLPNAALGSLFYLLAALYGSLFAASSPGRLAFFAASVFSITFSAYLAYILAVVLKDFCLVCVSSYVVNLGIFAASAFDLATSTAGGAAAAGTGAKGAKGAAGGRAGASQATHLD